MNLPYAGPLIFLNAVYYSYLLVWELKELKENILSLGRMSNLFPCYGSL